MPIIKSAIKRARQSEVRRLRNLKAKTAIKKDTRAVLDNPSAKDVQDKLSMAYSHIDKAVKTGLLHKNTAARRKARLAKAIASAAPKKSQTQSTKSETSPKTKNPKS